MWKIITRNNNEISISNDEYEGICKVLNQAKLFRLESGTIINSSDIIRVEPSMEQTTIAKEYRLPDAGGTDKDEKIRMPGGWQTIKDRESMVNLFNKMKQNGSFKDFNSYEEWERAKYKDDLVESKNN